MFTLDDLFSSVSPGELNNGFIPRLIDMGFGMDEIEEKVDDYLWEVEKTDERKILKSYRLKVIEFLKSMRKGKKISGKIYPEDIELAKLKPIDSLIEVNHANFAVCPNHTDTRPSLKAYHSRVHCFVCGWDEDVVGLYQKIHNVDFITAVKSLI